MTGSGGLRKALKNHVQEFVFCESPHLVLNPSETTETSEKGWWFSSESSYNALEVSDCQKGYFYCRFKFEKKFFCQILGILYSMALLVF